MTILHRTTRPHPNESAKSDDGSDSSTCKGHHGHNAPMAPVRRRKQLPSGRRWSFSRVRDELEDWMLVAACIAVLFVCTLWFFGKVMAVFSWFFLPMIDSIVTSMSRTTGSGGRHSLHHPLQETIPLNKAYAIPHAHPSVGDRSLHYAILRQEIDSVFPEDNERSIQRARELHPHKDLAVAPTIPLDHNSDQLPKPAYDIYHCPPTPPPGYPFQWKITDIVHNWNPEDTNVPEMIYNGLCVFDYQKDFDTAMTYRNAELPFVVVNDPRIAATAERWNHPGYMERMLGDVKHRTTRSDTNHFLYAIPPPQKKRFRGNPRHTAPPGWHEPTESLRMSYTDWLKHANVTDEMSAPDQPHWYYRLIGCGLTGPDGSCDRGSSEYLYDEMPYFQPSPGGLYLRDAEKQKGIHCRFGQKGIVADNHFDAGRNTIVVLGGSRRYMLASPDQCPNMALFDKNHPSARHSEVSWSDPNDWERFPQFKQAMGNEVVMQAGDALYLPNNWFHHIISLEMNFQCNTRSGKGQEYMQEVWDCGFDEM